MEETISGREVHLFKRHWQVWLWGRPSPLAFNMFFGQGRHLSLRSLHLTTFVLHCCQKSTILCKVCVVDGMTLHGMIMKHGSKPVCGPSRTFIRILFFLFYWSGDDKVVRKVWAAHFVLNVEDFKLFVVNGIARMLWHSKLCLVPSFCPACCSNHKPLYFECIMSYHSGLSLKFFILHEWWVPLHYPPFILQFQRFKILILP
jgi:hypothetical protein